MNRDDVIRMARDIGLVDDLGNCVVNDAVDLLKFASLVAAHEREKAAKVCDEQYRVLEVRRAHAEGSLGGANYAYFVPTMEIVAKCAAAIRQRGSAD